jgi:DHA1 family bicyclomycin/chloramphenicol resistance-like MFS transporter
LARPHAPGTLLLTILLGFLTALGPLSTDMYLPSLPAIGRHFAASSGAVQLTLSAYLIGFAIGLPLYGPLSDRRGRKKVMFAGLALYGAASLFAAIAPSLDMLIGARFVQGFGAAGPLVIARAIVRDLYEGRRAGQELARMGSIMGIVPAIAPILGVGLELAFGWRANFVMSAALVALLALWAMTKLPETLRARITDPFSLAVVMGGFGTLIRDRRFLPFALLAAATYTGLFAFISGSSFIYQLHFKVSELAFAIAFVMMVLGFISGAYLAQRIAMRTEPRRLLKIGVILQSGGGIAMLFLALLAPHPATMTLAMMAYAAGVGFTLPQSMAQAMMPFPDRAGAASSLIGILQMGIAAIIGAGVGAFIDRGPVVLAGTVALSGLAALALYRVIRRK